MEDTKETYNITLKKEELISLEKALLITRSKFNDKDKQYVDIDN